MMLEEFEARTGYYPSSETYRVIEEEYVQFEGDKDAFCKAFKLNTNGLATRIQRTLNSQRWQKIREAEAEKAALKKQIEELQKKLDHELEWQPYEMKENTRQADYDHLRASCTAFRPMRSTATASSGEPARLNASHSTRRPTGTTSASTAAA